ncbi:MAG TPA: metal ABC transporter permease [Oxalobacteraceae bacterium]|nr:metal ABC transporter permease [Oxalobacteraceae bacterium]
MKQSSKNTSGQPAGPNILRSLWNVVSLYRDRVIYSLLFLILAKIATVGVPLMLKRIVDHLSRPETIHTLPVLILLGYAILRFSSTLFTELRDLFFSRVTQHTVAEFAQKTFTHLHELGASFHARRHLGGLLPNIDRGTAGISFLLGVGLFTLVPTLVEIGMVLAIMLANYSIGFTVVIAATFALYTGFTLFFTQRRAIFQRRVNRLDTNAKNRLADSLINADAVKYFTNEKLEARRFERIMGRWVDAAVSNQKALFILHVGQSGIIAIGVASVMLLAGQGVVSQQMTVGDLVLINAYVIQICLPLNALGFVYREVRDALINAERLLELLREKPDIEEPPGLPDLQLRQAEVAFEHVDFQYDPGRPILHDINFTIPAGTTLAVVGGSGSGKSTLARLLLRFYDVGAGRITIDGQDIRSVNTASLRHMIGVVPQDTILFNDSIAYNIAYGRPTAGRSEVIGAAQAAQIHDFISSLPQGYDTPVGERGVMISGGEKQRIALARAILKNPPILIFDEATSALDLQSERAIQVELDRLARNRTTLVIAHRLSTIVGADQIIVLEQGHIVERGAHASLLQQDGAYANLWRLQEHGNLVENS